MHNLINKITSEFYKDKISSYLFMLISFCFVKTHLIVISLIIILSLFQLYRIIKKDNDEKPLITTYFYLLIYAQVFTGSVIKVILLFLLLFLWIHIRSQKTLNNPLKYYIPETFLLIFSVLIFINHLIFPPYLRGLDVYILFLLIPLLFIGLKRISIKINVIKSIKVYITAVLVISFLLILINAFNRTLMIKTNTFFSQPINITHVYFGMFLGTASCFLLILNLKKKNYYSSFVDGIILLFFIVLTAYVGARISLAAIFFVVGYFGYQKLPLKKYIKLPLSLIFLVLLSFFAIKTPRAQSGLQNIKNVYTSVLTNNKQDLVHNSWRNMYQRFLVIKYTLNQIKENPITGIGIQNVTNKISTKIITDGFIYFKPINSHNQYLHFFVGMGVFSFIYFLFILYYFIITVHKNYIIFFIFFLIIMFTESILVREKGISLFLLFSLFFLNDLKAKND